MGVLTQFFNLFKPAKTDSQAVAKLNENMDIIDTEMHRPPLSVNGIFPDSTTRDLTLNEVPLAGNLSSDDAQSTFGTYIERSTGGAASVADGSGWLVSIKGKSVKTGYIPESLDMTVTPATRQEGEQAITATLDRDTFVAAVSSSGTITLTYTTAWSADPATYGVTIEGTPVNGDVITIVYVKENRGTITNATPVAFNSTGWNLYNHSNGYAKVVKYSDTYGFCISGAWSLVEFATTPTGSRTTITPVEGYFSIPSDGYVIVTGGNSTTTEIYMTWSDWILPEDHPSFAAYSVDSVSVADVMVDFVAGLCSVGVVKDEINLNTQTAISRIQRLAYTAQNLAAVIASGVDYDTDENYIYAVREEPEVYDIEVDGEYTVNDHGIEFITGTSVPCEVETLYGNDLKGKLRRDVLTISAQQLTSSQQTQVRTNLGLGAASTKAVANNLTTATAGTAVLDAYQGKLLSDQIGNMGFVTDTTHTVKSGTDATIHFPLGYRGILYICSTNTNSMGLYLIFVTTASDGAVAIVDIYNGNYLSHTKSAQTVVFSSTGSANSRINFITFTGENPTVTN